MAEVGKYRNLATSNVCGFLQDVDVKVKSCTKKDGYFVMSVEHGDFEWSITKTFRDISRLNKKIRIRTMFRMGRRNKVGVEIPALGRDTDRSYKCEEITPFLNWILLQDELKARRSVIRFFNVSKFSFISELGSKGTEGEITIEYKDTKGCLWNCWNYLSGGNKRWAVLKDHCMVFINNRNVVRGLVQIDHEFAIEHSPDDDKVGITIRNTCCEIQARCNSEQQARMWKLSADIIFANNSDGITKLNDLDSFSPLRLSYAKWFVDGHNYYEAVADAMEQAREQIFITDWIFSPTIRLKRDELDLHWRLDLLLKRKAEQGVKVYVLIYKEIPFTVANYSREARDYLRSLHNNLIVQLHPLFSLKDAFWSNHEKLVVVDQNIAFVGGIDLAYNRYDLASHPISDYNPDVPNYKRWEGKDYNNLYAKDRLNFEDMSLEYDENYRKTHGRTPWHDIAAMTYGKTARDVSRHFVQRWNHAKYEQNNEDIDFLIPKSFSDKMLNELMPNDQIFRDGVEAKVQVLRSSSKWASGHDYTESSIHNAFIKLIEKSEKYIYIENQYFISNIKETQNKVVKALYERILRASENKENFRVYIILPLLPSAENDIRYDNTSQSIQTILGFQYRSINRADGSLLKSLESLANVSDYVSFCSLASHGTINGKIRHEILYVHSKMMIVDDRYSIIGSANINERSLNGDRDSDMALLIEDTKFIKSKMGDVDYEVGVFSSGLRKRCFAEHCGLLPDGYHEEYTFQPTVNIDDIVCDKFYNNIWCKTASTNTMLFEKIFAIVPTNQILDFSEESLKQYESKKISDPDLINEELAKIKGHLIQFPLHALENEDLTPDFGAKESFAPDAVFV